LLGTGAVLIIFLLLLGSNLFLISILC
jgi:hypothetical protein